MDFHDPYSSLTHLFFAGWAVFAGLVLVRLTRGHGRPRRRAVVMYVASVVLLYTASGVFHGKRFASSAEAEVFRRLDLSAIFLLIAGSYQPLFAYLLNRRWRLWVGGLVGAVTAGGIGAVWGLDRLSSAELVPAYVGLAVLGLVPVRRYAAAAGWRAVGRMFVTAGIYLSGAICEVMKWPLVVPGWVGPHEVLHTTDMAGTLVHFGLVVRVVRDSRIVRPTFGS